METKQKITAVILTGGFLFLVGPYGTLMDLLQGEFKGWILTGFTFGAWIIGVVFTYRLIDTYEKNNKQIPPASVILGGFVFLMLYLCASAFR